MLSACHRLPGLGGRLLVQSSPIASKAPYLTDSAAVIGSNPNKNEDFKVKILVTCMSCAQTEIAYSFCMTWQLGHQIWPLTIFSVSFLWKIIDLRGGKINDPLVGEILVLCSSSQQLPRLRLGPLKGFLSWHGALLRPSTRLVRCFRNYRDTRTPSGVAR